MVAGKQKTLPQNSKELKSKREKKPILGRGRELGILFTDYSCFFIIFCQFELQTPPPLLIKPPCFIFIFLLVVPLLF